MTLYICPSLISNPNNFDAASLAPLGALTGGLLAGIPLSRFGRRPTLLFTAALYVASFAVLGSSSAHESLPVILVARVMNGLAVGCSIPAAQIYVRASIGLF